MHFNFRGNCIQDEDNNENSDFIEEEVELTVVAAIIAIDQCETV